MSACGWVVMTGAVTVAPLLDELLELELELLEDEELELEDELEDELLDDEDEELELDELVEPMPTPASLLVTVPAELETTTL